MTLIKKHPAVVQLRLGISNAFLVRGSRSVLVDVGSHRNTTALIQALKRENVDPGEVSLILHTHGHGDHCAASRASRQTVAAPIAIHPADASMLRSGRNQPLVPTRLSGRLLKPLVDRPFPGIDPDVLIDRETSLEDYGVEARIILTPGHTAGSISVITGDGDAIVGDIMMGGHLGGMIFSDRPRYHYFADDLDAVRTSIKKVMGHSPRKIYVGHGGPLEPSAVLDYFAGDIDF
jgi:glyoxylase-like metal-dependent hydrolase (beta-lactamase superfamily II)